MHTAAAVGLAELTNGAAGQRAAGIVAAAVEDQGPAGSAGPTGWLGSASAL
eukprot:COSAG01_NODE_862_length_13058_cov_6.823366_2_plen_51_part_00